MTVVYSLRKKENTEEVHIFLADKTDTGCVSRLKSICRKMAKAETSDQVKTCLKEGEARTESARLGRQVCGTCVSHLYATY
ncbi:hypothetical protein PAGU2196_34200 [Pseudomonas sp. PAGU 2196]|uniref:hypothetical protein n=1 Tax=Pseudomonas sp. PAGU 2196 TaxID=2793997 RepID=UPI001EDD9FE2|nr:hypothetical protein [Pseudomonas sp. PAGU 2196]GHS82586.1 hypothetical protein PAGU2196_34200 [Pseudomonas sp. PAGU 2196]